MKAVFKEARATLALAIPITIGQISQMLMGVADSVMIGRTGTLPLAASSFGVSVFNVFFIIGVGLLTPVAVFASRSRGAGRHDEAGEYLRHGLVLSLGAGILEVAVIAFISFHLAWFGQPPEVVARVNPFFLLLGFSLLPVLAYLALRQFAESMGRPWVSVFVVLGGVALNIAPGTGSSSTATLARPAWAWRARASRRSSPRTLASAVIFTGLVAWTRPCAPLWPRRWFAPLSWERIRRMLGVGLPTAGSLTFEGVARLCRRRPVMMGVAGRRAARAPTRSRSRAWRSRSWCRSASRWQSACA